MRTKHQRLDITAEQRASIVAWASETSVILTVYIFGSRAKGTSKIESDLDVAIEVKTQPGLTNKNTYDQHWLEWVEYLEEVVGLKVELLRLHAENPKTFAAVEDHGVLVYRKS